MHRVTEPGRAASLVVELGSGTAVVDGERLELPVKELKLLAELAARPGEAVPSPELIAAVWPEASWITPQDLYWHISQLRRGLGGSERARKLIRNRRGFGYLLDLPPEEVIVVDADPALGVQPETIWLDEPETASEVATSTEEDGAKPLNATSQSASERRLRIPRLASTALLVAGLVAASWSAGYALSKWRAGSSLNNKFPEVVPEAPQQAPEQTKDVPRERPKNPSRNRHQGKSSERDDRHPRRGGGRNNHLGTVAPSNDTTDAPPSGTQPAQPPGSETSGTKKPPEVSLPPAPTRYLYHLVNAESGDHFVTTDGGVASEKEAKGYEGGTIGLVYTSAEDNTKAVTTNYGTAYIFMGDSPKTDPPSRTVALWYSTDNDGDFFYTTSKAEASKKGWTATLIGYVRKLS